MMHHPVSEELNLTLRGTGVDVRVYSYVIEHDLGFAPNPFHGICTLAACKPKIRHTAKVGDYIVGTGAAKPGIRGCLSYWMYVGEILTFDQYWVDSRFRKKRPYMRGSLMQRYGDNIYHRDPQLGSFLQADSFHSEVGGAPSAGNLERDTGTTDRVLVGAEFAYWGGNGPRVPSKFSDFVASTQGHKCRFDEGAAIDFIDWLHSRPGRGFLSEPAHWQFL